MEEVRSMMPPHRFFAVRMVLWIIYFQGHVRIAVIGVMLFLFL